MRALIHSWVVCFFMLFSALLVQARVTEPIHFVYPSTAFLYNKKISEAVEKRNYQEIYDLTIREKLSSTFFENIIIRFLKEVNRDHKNVFERDRQIMQKVLQRMSLSNLSYMINIPSEIRFQDLELPDSMRMARAELIQRAQSLLGNAVQVARCDFDYIDAKLTIASSTGVQTLANDFSFCLIINSSQPDTPQSVVMVDMLSSRERLVTCSKDRNKNVCLETSAQVLTEYRMQDYKDSQSAFESLHYRHYSVSIFKPVGAILETGEARIPIYCVHNQTRLFKTQHRMDCQGEARY